MAVLLTYLFAYFVTNAMRITISLSFLFPQLMKSLLIESPLQKHKTHPSSWVNICAGMSRKLG
jgi:hypothetical protein